MCFIGIRAIRPTLNYRIREEIAYTRAIHLRTEEPVEPWDHRGVRMDHLDAGFCRWLALRAMSDARRELRLERRSFAVRSAPGRAPRLRAPNRWLTDRALQTISGGALGIVLPRFLHGITLASGANRRDQGGGPASDRPKHRSTKLLIITQECARAGWSFLPQSQTPHQVG